MKPIFSWHLEVPQRDLLACKQTPIEFLLVELTVTYFEIFRNSNNFLSVRILGSRQQKLAGYFKPRRISLEGYWERWRAHKLMGEVQSLAGKICRSQGALGEAGRAVNKYKSGLCMIQAARNKCLIGYQGMCNRKVCLLFRDRPQYKKGPTAKTMPNGQFPLKKDHSVHR